MKIGVLASGGDSPGMTACWVSIVRAGVGRDHEVLGRRARIRALGLEALIVIGGQRLAVGRARPPPSTRGALPFRDRRPRGGA